MCSLSGAVRHRQGWRSALAAAQACIQGLWPATIELQVVLVSLFNGLQPRNPYYSLTDLGGWKAEFA